VIDLAKKLPKHCRIVPEVHVRRQRKRQRANSEADLQSLELVRRKEHGPESRNCTICLRYNSMLYLDFMSADEMVVVEQPWLSVVAGFPEALQRRVYGCN
jgi:hypothetical protein